MLFWVLVFRLVGELPGVHLLRPPDQYQTLLYSPSRQARRSQNSAGPNGK